MSKKIFFVLFCCAVFILDSCNKDETSEKLLAEEQEFAKYMEENHPDAEVVSDKQVYIKVITSNPEGLIPASGKNILINFDVRLLYDDILEYTSDLEKYLTLHPQSPPTYLYGGPELYPFLPGQFFFDAVGKMKEGETADIYFSSRHNIFTIPMDFSPRKASVELISVIKDLNAYQETLMSKYLKENTYTQVDTIDVKSTADNDSCRIFYSIIDEGKGEAIVQGDDVDVTINCSYILKNTSKQEFVSEKKVWRTAEGENVVFQTYRNFVTDILTRMKRGGKAVITMPYIIYCGKNPIQNDKKQYIIAEGSAIIIEMSINQ